MKDNFYLKRLGALIIKGIQTGIVLSFLSSLVYDILFMAIMLLTSVNPGYPINNDDVTGLFILSSILCLGFIPAILFGAIDGILIGIMLAFWKTSLPNILASFIGLIVGAILISTIDYLIWRYNLIPFSIDTSDLFFITPFLKSIPIHLLPSFIAIPISAYAGWKINKSKVLETISS